MRKIITWLIPAFIIVTFCSCGTQQLKKSISVAEPGYTCKADISYNGIVASADISVNGGGVLSAELTSPQTVKGMKYSYNNGKAVVSFMGIEYSPESDEKLGGIAPSLDSALGKLGSGGETISMVDGEYSVTGKTGDAEYVLFFTDDGFPKTLKIESYKLEANFSDWKYQ